MILFSAKTSDKHQDKLKANFPEQVFIFGDSINDVKEYVHEAEIIVTFGNGITTEIIEKAKKLKWIMVMSAGVDKMPVAEIKDKGIFVTNVRGIHKIPMAEYAISMILQVYRQAKTLVENERNHIWDGSVHMHEITGKTMLIAGTGAIGQEVARLAKAFQMKTIGISRSGSIVPNFDKNGTTEELSNLLPAADFVVSVLPSTTETEGLFTYEHFQQMPDHAVFLNMGRGDLVQRETILKAIRNKEIAHVILDVFDQEPLPESHPFWQEENITVTPHLSGVTSNYMIRAMEIFSENLHHYLSENDNDYVNKINLTKTCGDKSSRK